MNAAEPIIEITAINKFFGSFKALTDVSLTITKGEKVVIIGPSGSGKSTLLRTINRLEPIDSGSIVIDGVEINSPACDINKVRAEVGMVF
ncbi:MAG: ATP-binding cassette domain-containing protein, partial [Thermodesulfobacteriota bacterium]